MNTKKTKKVARVVDESEGLKATWLEVCRKQKGLMTMMILLAVMSIVLLVVALTMLRPANTVVIVGYGDVYGEIAGISGGYRRQSWANMFAYVILAVMYGLVHNLLTLRIYRKYGKDMAMVMIMISMLLVIATFVVMLRLVGEW